MAMRQERRPPLPLDAAALERLALRYVERFATTRGKLADYLGRKIRERGWDGDPTDPRALAQRMADLGYVDDRSFAESKAAALGRRGFGARRVTMALRQAGIEEEDSAPLAPAIQERAGEAALTFARRKRIGPFGPPTEDRKVRDRQLAAMLRAGHGFEIARRIVLAHNEEDVGELD
jgi:regulatory protein